MILKPDFYNRSTEIVAKDLLGKYIVRQIGSNKLSVMITDVEAYDGPLDKACHAYKGKTTRTEVMFGPAGFWYVYFIYGKFWLLNIVTGPKDYPAAVLIRGSREVTGPARLTNYLKVDKRFNEQRAIRKNGLWIEDRGIEISRSQIKKAPRIGVDYAEEWAKKPYRFYLEE